MVVALCLWVTSYTLCAVMILDVVFGLVWMDGLFTCGWLCGVLFMASQFGLVTFVCSLFVSFRFVCFAGCCCLIFVVG